MSPKDSQKTLCLLMRLGTMTGRDGVTDPVTDDGSDRGVPQTKTGTRSVSDLSLEVLGL